MASLQRIVATAVVVTYLIGIYKDAPGHVGTRLCDPVRGTVFASPENIQDKARPIKNIEKNTTNPNSDLFERFHDPPHK